MIQAPTAVTLKLKCACECAVILKLTMVALISATAGISCIPTARPMPEDDSPGRAGGQGGFGSYLQVMCQAVLDAACTKREYLCLTHAGLCVQVAREAFGTYLQVVRQAVLDAASAGAARAAGLRPPPDGTGPAAEQLPGAVFAG